jgi:hypothetical protein
MIRLTDEQWKRIRGHFPGEQIPEGRLGRLAVLQAALTLFSPILFRLNGLLQNAAAAFFLQAIAGS